MYVHSSIHLLQRDFQTTLTSLKTLFAWTSRMLKAKWRGPKMLGKCKRRHFFCLNESNRLKWTKHAKVPNNHRKNELIRKFFGKGKNKCDQKKVQQKKSFLKRRNIKNLAYDLFTRNNVSLKKWNTGSQSIMGHNKCNSKRHNIDICKIKKCNTKIVHHWKL